MPSEFTLIDRYFKRPTPHAVRGPGDDAAIVRPSPDMELLVSTDMLVAGTHFLPDADPADIGWKTLAVNVSDIAAMGGEPRWALLAAALPQADEEWIERFARGLFDCADAFGIELIGGDTTRGPLNFCVTIFGEAPPGTALLRSGARPGHDIWVSGTPGLAALGLAHQQGRATLAESTVRACLNALHRPQPRVALGRALRGVASAAIDISDGLLADLQHILDESCVSARIELDRLPRAALETGSPLELARDCLLAGGDDYELLFCAARSEYAKIIETSARLALPLACIGEITTGPDASLELFDAGHPIIHPKRGYDHFA